MACNYRKECDSRLGGWRLICTFIENTKRPLFFETATFQMKVIFDHFKVSVHGYRQKYKTVHFRDPVSVLLGL